MTLTTPPYLCVQGKGHKFFIEKDPNPKSDLNAISTPSGTKKAYLQPAKDDYTIIVEGEDPQYVFRFVK